MRQSEHVFALCQRGAEATLKREIARLRPTWAPGYQRPGIVTFRVPQGAAPDVELDSVFARAWGMSLGLAADVDAALTCIEGVEGPLRVHVIERDLVRPDEEPKGFVRGELAREVEAQLRERLGTRASFGGTARHGELVLDVIVARGDPWLLGLHQHAKGRCPHPGGRYPVDVPEDAPSRAYAKIEEAIQAFGLPIRSGDVAVEIGAAPGGAAYALLRRGVRVVGVDPGDMDPHVLGFEGPGGARLVHLPIAVGALTREQLPERVDWLLMDVHLAPQVALRAIRRIVGLLRPGLRGVVFTLKLNDWSFADRIDDFVAQVRAMGVESPRARQLASHRQEIAIAGTMPKKPARNRRSTSR